MPADALLKVTLSPAHAEALRSAVASGEFPDVDASLADALDAWACREARRADELLRVKAKIRASLADPDPDLSIDEVEARLQLMFERAARRADEAA